MSMQASTGEFLEEVKRAHKKRGVFGLIMSQCEKKIAGRPV
jgi:hypothetical protein